MKKKLIYAWEFLTPFLLSFASFVFKEPCLLVLALISLPLVLNALPCKKQECVWGALILFVTFIPQNVLLFQVLVGAVTGVQALFLIILAISNEVLFGTLYIYMFFPNQKPIDGGNDDGKY